MITFHLTNGTKIDSSSYDEFSTKDIWDAIRQIVFDAGYFHIETDNSMVSVNPEHIIAIERHKD